MGKLHFFMYQFLTQRVAFIEKLINSHDISKSFLACIGNPIHSNEKNERFFPPTPKSQFNERARQTTFVR